MALFKDTSQDKGLPAAIAAERTILGAILGDNGAFFEHCEDLKADDFHLDSHRRIFRAINDILYGLVEGRTSVECVSLGLYLTDKKQLEAVGGTGYLWSLTEGMPRRIDIEQYVRIVKDKGRLRRLMLACNEIGIRAGNDGETPKALIAAMEVKLTEVAAEDDAGAVRIGELCHAVEKSVMKNRVISDEAVALDMTWGLEPLDERTKGIHGGEITILSGDSGAGKTSALIQAVLANAQRGVPCGIFSMEMAKEGVLRRFYPMLSVTLTPEMMRDPRVMNLEHVAEMKRISKDISKLPIWIDDTSPLTLPKMIARAKMMRRKHGIRLIGADYLQLITLPGVDGVAKTETVMYGLRDFIKTAPDTGLVLLSQYAKAQGFVKKNRRTKGDLYGGAVIHQAAQNVLLITVEDAEKHGDNENLDAEIMIDKQREGRKARVACSQDRNSLKLIPREEGTNDVSSNSGNDSKQRAAGN